MRIAPWAVKETARTALAVAAATFAISDESNAQALDDQFITISVEQKSIERNGELQGCALNFEIGIIRKENNNNAITYITGSLNYNVFAGQNPFFALKLGVKSGSPSAVFTAPATAHLVAGESTNAQELINTIDSDTEGFRLFMFETQEKTLYASMDSVFATGILRFGYSMRVGGEPRRVPVNLRMREFNFSSPRESKINAETPREWASCIGRASTVARRRLDVVEALSNKAARQAAIDAAIDAARQAAEAAVAPAKGAKPHREFVIGKWGTDGNCELAMDLRSDGTSDRSFGNWSYADGVIKFADAPEMKVAVTVVDDKTMESRNSSGGSHKMTRCP